MSDPDPIVLAPGTPLYRALESALLDPAVCVVGSEIIEDGGHRDMEVCVHGEVVASGDNWVEALIDYSELLMR